MTAAARRLAELQRLARLRRDPAEVRRDREAPPARHDRLRPRSTRARHRDGGPNGDGRARRRRAGVRDRPRRAAPGGQRRVRERDALPRARLRRHALGLGRPRQRRRRARPRSRPARRTARAGATLLAAIVGGNEVVTRDRHGGVRRVPRPRLPPDGDLRRLRRDDGRRAGSPALDAERPRARSASPARSPAASSPTSTTRPRRSRCIRPGPRTAACSPRGSPRSAQRARPAVLEGRFGVYYAFVGATTGEVDLARAARRPRHALGDAAHRLQAVPRLPLHPRLARRDGRALVGERRPRRDRGDRRLVPDAGVAARARAGRLEAGSAQRVRGEVQPAVLDRRDARPRPGRRAELHRRGDRRPARARARRARCATRRRSTPPTRLRSPAACGSRRRDGRTLEADVPNQLGGPENPMSADEVRAKFRENAALALGDAELEALEEAVLDARGAGRPGHGARAVARRSRVSIAV